MTDWLEQYKSCGLTPQAMAQNFLFSMERPDFEKLRFKAAVEAGCDIDAQVDLLGLSLLGKALCARRKDLVTALLDAGASPNVQDTQGETPLVYAAHRFEAETISELIKAGGDANITDNQGRSVLVSAVISGRLDIVKAMAENNSKLTIKTIEDVLEDPCGHTIEVRASGNFTDIEAYLKTVIIEKDRQAYMIANGLPLLEPLAVKPITLRRKYSLGRGLS